MTRSEILSSRLHNQGISSSRFSSVGEAVKTLGAFQAQDYPGALWSIGLRVPGSTQQDIEKAIANREIVRTWPMRGTLHFVAAEDVRWMLKLLSPKVKSRGAYRNRQLALTGETFDNSRTILSKALQGKQLARSEIYSILDSHGVSPEGQRGVHILWRLSQDGLLCHGSHLGKEPSFVLLDEWVPTTREMSPDEAVAELTLRYFTGHGPATVQDFVWWSGLTVTEVRAGLEMNKDKLHSEQTGDAAYWLRGEHRPALKGAYLLPGFDEYMLGYSDRSIALDPEHSEKIVPGGNGMFMPTLVINGKVEGLWRKKATAKKLVVSLDPFTEVKKSRLAAIRKQVNLYGHFIGLPTELNEN